MVDGFAKSPQIVMPVLDQVQDDGSGIQNILNLLDSGFRRNDVKSEKLIFYEFVMVQGSRLKVGILSIQ